ncbi:hypothetical protein EYF80_018450 [Liparis tanakae]|uniref:Uncharacterized protein n=1 Tax=Liparis tanakae TaxID=230148 RepID=A0A4Z2I2B7_9TELE|nr:hypothetical protein EYF80_018450 [Liparis tanakae]
MDPVRTMNQKLRPIHSIGSRLQHWLKLSGHADVFLFLTDDALDGGRQTAGVPGKHDAVAVVAAAIFLQGAAGIMSEIRQGETSLCSLSGPLTHPNRVTRPLEAADMEPSSSMVYSAEMLSCRNSPSGSFFCRANHFPAYCDENEGG